jgi:hypothetical protein
MNRTKKELKEIVQVALENEYGFKPFQKDITLLESSGDGTYIYFKVNNNVYQFLSYITTCGDMKTVWVGEGTITKL